MDVLLVAAAAGTASKDHGSAKKSGLPIWGGMLPVTSQGPMASSSCAIATRDPSGRACQVNWSLEPIIRRARQAGRSSQAARANELIGCEVDCWSTQTQTRAKLPEPDHRVRLQRNVNRSLARERRSAEVPGAEYGLFEPIGNIPPAAAEQRYYALLDDVPMAA
jgi:hypothetical protein